MSFDFNSIRPMFGGHLTQQQVDGVNNILTPIWMAFGQIAFACAIGWQAITSSAQGFLNRIPSFEPIVQNVALNSIMSSGSGKRMEVHSVNIDGDQIPFVFAALRFWRHPSAVSLFIISSWVFAVNLMARTWLKPHVVQEQRKRLIPFLGYANASRSVFWKVLVGRIRASTLNAKPRLVFGARVAAFLVAVLDFSARWHLHFRGYLFIRTPQIAETVN